MEVGLSKVSVKVWGENPADAVEKAKAENKIENCSLKIVKEL